MNRSIWTNYDSDIPCPTCGTGVLIWNNRGIIKETLLSLKKNEFHKNGIVNPDTTSIGCQLLQCSKCTDVVAMTYLKHEDVRHMDENGVEQHIIEPISYYPAPKIIPLPKSCPDSVKDLINQSFSLFWNDLNSCGNKIRVSVEALMEEFKIPSRTKKDKIISLHSRIKEFALQNAQVGKYLLSIKFIGNSGSHISGLTKEAILDAYIILEYSLELLYNDREKDIDDLSKKYMPL